jgi:hypothetical protein
MFLGRRVDDAITLDYRRILEHGERLSVDHVKDAFWDGGRPPPNPSATSSGSPGKTTAAELGVQRVAG